MQYLKTFIFFFIFSASYAQQVSFNTELISTVGFGNENSNDIWGFVDSSGIHYAIIGNFRNTRVFSLEDPKNPILRYTVPGAQSTWRDIKSYKNHLYVTTDQGTDGLIIIDMTFAPDSITHINYQPVITVGMTTKNLERCHNLYIDEKGYCYLAGCNISNRGVLIFDLKNNPNAPELVGAADVNYSHDAYARGDTLYSSEINVGQLGIYDVTDRSNPVLLASRTTSRFFTHNAWVSDDGKYVFTTDEREDAYVDAYDITDLNDIKLLDKFRPLERENQGVIPHNTHYHKGYLVTSWYTDGLRITDAHRPDNLVEVAFYDTWEDQTTCHNGFKGCWGAFPFTNSNLIYASDINNGLFIIDVDYKRASYLEGTVKNEQGIGINNAFVKILSPQINRKYSDPSGVFKTGHAFEGDYEVEVTHPDYQPTKATLNFIAGEVTNWDVVMTRNIPGKLDFQITDKLGQPIKAKLKIQTQSETFFAQSNDFGLGNISLPSSRAYSILITAWGYQSKLISNYNVGDANTLSITLEDGYEDFFDTDLDWEIQSSINMIGAWERAIPSPTFYINQVPANPGFDAPTDLGDYAYVTGNGIGGAPCNDVDNGVTTAISPVIDLSKYIKPRISFSTWFFIAGGNGAFDDTLRVFINNGLTQTEIYKVGRTTNGWERTEDLLIEDFIELTANMTVIFEVSDLAPNGHIVEAGFDHFLITNGTSNTAQVSNNTQITIVPNPSYDKIFLQNSSESSVSQYSIFNRLGQDVISGSLNKSQSIDIQLLLPGLYFIKFDDGQTLKFIKI